MAGSQIQWNWKELTVVAALTVLVGLVFWFRFLPLPDGDLNFYTEPAYLLAKFGWLAGPGSQYVDLTYQKGIYNYPPGHYLILGGWIKLFGLSDDSLLAFTHLIHSSILVLLWALIRFRYGCSRLIAALSLIAIFPKAPHGRPDMTACFLAIASWLALPLDRSWKKILLSGGLAGATLLVSPAYGVATIATLFVIITVNGSLTWRDRLRFEAVWIIGAGLVFAGITLVVLSWQHSWALAYAQFTTNLAIRGAQTNAMPNLRVLYTWAFCVVPFGIIAVLPALVVIVLTWKSTDSILRVVTLAFLGGTLAWLLTNKLQFLTEYHYLFPAKSVFLAVLCSRTRIPLWARVLPLILLSAIGWYLFKANFMYLATPLRAEHARYSENSESGEILAVDSLYFATTYRPGRTLNYEPYKNAVLWPTYLKAMPKSLRAELLQGLPTSPLVPQVFVVSSFSAVKYGQPTGDSLTCKGAERGFEQLRFAGRAWRLPANPYALLECTTQ